jgi:hypothetical protein
VMPFVEDPEQFLATVEPFLDSVTRLQAAS